jgi:hypothetical protein
VVVGGGVGAGGGATVVTGAGVFGFGVAAFVDTGGAGACCVVVTAEVVGAAVVGE